MLIDRPELEQLIPHGRQMCLLDQVIEWDQKKVICNTDSHRRHDNPLLETGRLGAVILVEFGAQAAAIHTALVQCGGKGRRPAYLGAVKELKLRVDFIEEIDGTLTVEAHCILNNANGAIYSIHVKSAEQQLITGRITLIQAA